MGNIDAVRLNNNGIDPSSSPDRGQQNRGGEATGQVRPLG
jgi:hypothetical protein